MSDFEIDLTTLCNLLLLFAIVIPNIIIYGTMAITRTGCPYLYLTWTLFTVIFTILAFLFIGQYLLVVETFLLLFCILAHLRYTVSLAHRPPKIIPSLKSAEVTYTPLVSVV